MNTACSLAHATEVVTNLYKNGSDTRQMKNGSPGALIEKIMSARPITTCGLYRHLSSEEMDMVCDKKSSPVFQKRVAGLLLEHANRYDKHIYCKVTDIGMNVLKCILAEDYDTYPAKDMKFIFNLSHIFENQEREKIRPNRRNTTRKGKRKG